MSGLTEEETLVELDTDHIQLTEKLSRKHFGLAIFRLQIEIWIRSHGRRAMMFLVLAIGLLICRANITLLKSANMNVGELITLVACGLVFAVIWLSTSGNTDEF